ncbi:hypothetical protein B0T09DRAFT_367643 [Sordaria sp. MPI-SDFR-AT-0083]|nr:hypothetical protein B0T09DRAFT_367643 [Sordaria sp. MPI-SDFR-AT-0083]
MPSDFDPIDDPYWEDADVGYDTCKAEEIMDSNNDKLNNRSAEPSSTNGKEEAGDGTLAGQAGSTSKSEYTKPWTGGTEDFMTSRNEINRISVSEGYRKMADNIRKVAGKDGGDGGKKK